MNEGYRIQFPFPLVMKLFLLFHVRKMEEIWRYPAVCTFDSFDISRINSIGDPSKYGWRKIRKRINNLILLLLIRCVSNWFWPINLAKRSFIRQSAGWLSYLQLDDKKAQYLRSYRHQGAEFTIKVAADRYWIQFHNHFRQSATEIVKMVKLRIVGYTSIVLLVILSIAESESINESAERIYGGENAKCDHFGLQDSSITSGFPRDLLHGLSEYPDVYTRISSHLNFIRATARRF